MTGSPRSGRPGAASPEAASPRAGRPRAGLALGLALLAASGCTSGVSSVAPRTPLTAGRPASVTATVRGQDGEMSSAPRSHPAPTPRSSPPRSSPTGPAPAPREKSGPCPYISRQRVADIEGNRVGRSAVFTTVPPGCRFYFLYGDQHMTTRIALKRYPSALAAFNRVARTGGPGAFSAPGIGDAAVLYQTRFYPPDGNRDWACTFARGATVVTVYTDQIDPSTNARNLARAIVDRI